MEPITLTITSAMIAAPIRGPISCIRDSQMLIQITMWTASKISAFWRQDVEISHHNQLRLSL
jgi:hypothetical protein